jgi:hypothetical protein
MLKLLIKNTITPTSYWSLMRLIRGEVIRGCMGPFYGLEEMMERKMSDSTGNQTSVVQPVIQSLYWPIYTAFF